MHENALGVLLDNNSKYSILPKSVIGPSSVNYPKGLFG